MSNGLNDNKKLTISIDFDDTFTAIPDLLSLFIKFAIVEGHKVICITARHFEERNVNELKQTFEEYGINIPIHFSNHRSKKEYAKENGIDVDIWIDDMPEAIVHGIK